MDDKISELKKQLDLILENYAVDKVKSDSGGNRRSKKGILTKDIYSKIIQFAIEEIGLDFKFYYKKSRLPKKIQKQLPYLNLSENFEFNRKFDNSGKGNSVNYDGFLIFEGQIKMLLEFKSYTEVSMLKRVYLDAKIAKKFIPDVKYYLCMLESAFGTLDREDKKKASKDTAYLKHRYFISKSAITLIDYLQKTLNVEVNIFFLMNGIRDSKRDIGIKKFLKKVDLDELKFTVDSFINFFQSFKKN